MEEKVNNTKKVLSTNKPLIMGLTLLLLLLIFGGAYFLYPNLKNSSDEDEIAVCDIYTTPKLSSESNDVKVIHDRLVQDGDYEGAIKVAEDYISSGKANSQEQAYILIHKTLSLNQLAELNGEQKNDLEISEGYQEAVRLWPEDPLPYVELGRWYYQEGNNDQALEQYKKALNAYDNYATLQDCYIGVERPYIEALIKEVEEGDYDPYRLPNV